MYVCDMDNKETTDKQLFGDDIYLTNDYKRCLHVRLVANKATKTTFGKDICSH